MVVEYANPLLTNDLCGCVKIHKLD